MRKTFTFFCNIFCLPYRTQLTPHSPPHPWSSFFFFFFWGGGSIFLQEFETISARYISFRTENLEFSKNFSHGGVVVSSTVINLPKNKNGFRVACMFLHTSINNKENIFLEQTKRYQNKIDGKSWKPMDLWLVKKKTEIFLTRNFYWKPKKMKKHFYEKTHFWNF